MRILFLTQGTHTPSSRFRVQQFIPHFERAGIDCTVIAGYGAQYNHIAKTPWAAPYKLAMQTQRWVRGWQAFRYDVLFVQRPIFPFSPIPEQILFRINDRMIFDVDDAIFLSADNAPSSARQRTFERCVALSKIFVAGNGFLAERGQRTTRTVVIPTVIDTERFHPASNDTAHTDRIVIGWIGSATTLPFVDLILPALRFVRDRYANVVIRIVCSHMPSHLAEEERFEFVPWAPDTEIASIQRFDIGVMPIPDTDSSRGKCAFKMIQYMAVGTAVVASDIGANVEVFQDSHAGMLAHDDASWRAALERLVVDAPYRRACGQAAREHAMAHYSVQAVLPTYLEIFNEVASS